LAADLLSEVFLVVWRQAASFEAARQSRLGSLPSRATRRSRPGALERTLSWTRKAFPSCQARLDDPEVALLKKSRAELLRQSIARLSPEHREFIDLVYYHGKAVTEVAEIVGINAATAKTRMLYPRKRLAELVASAL
jgi:RNA polymerase sigma-70 factor (ECF subfamily)